MDYQKDMSQKGPSGEIKNAYKKVPIRRPRTITFGATPSSGLKVWGIEVCQTIQDMSNSVPLIAEKKTIVRIYLDPTSIDATAQLTGELVWRRSENGPAAYIPSMNKIKLDPANGLKLSEQREKMASSLNFPLPDTALSEGDLYLGLNRLIQLGGVDQPFSGDKLLNLTFHKAAPLHIKVIGLRYVDSNTQKTHTPSSTHFAYLRSYLERAYPVSEVIWSQVVIDADFVAPFGGITPVLANAQIAAIRNTEINAGIDPRTHYYALVDDANGANFMRGRASEIPSTPQPDTVASGPCGVPNGFSGDNDLSYADWYGAHELGHTFGRYHPGFPPGQQDASDPSFPYDNGQLTDNASNQPPDQDTRYIGFDVGDAALGLPMQPLSGTIYHDVMTYAEKQWLSAHTFEAIRVRLNAENEQFSPPIS